MNTTQTYLDKKGRRWLRIAETRSGLYAWFRPVARANDALFDRNEAAGRCDPVETVAKQRNYGK